MCLAESTERTFFIINCNFLNLGTRLCCHWMKIIEESFSTTHCEEQGSTSFGQAIDETPADVYFIRHVIRIETNFSFCRISHPEFLTFSPSDSLWLAVSSKCLDRHFVQQKHTTKSFLLVTIQSLFQAFGLDNYVETQTHTDSTR